MARDAIARVYASYQRVRPDLVRTYDREVRHPEWTDRLFDHFGRPDTAAYSVAITGSKGKGSHAILLAAILQQCGLRVGLFTGPHLVDFMERFRVNGQVMPEERFIAWMDEVGPVVEALPVPPLQYVGPVGILAVIASLWFREEKTDVNVVELGRGALHDDVNRWRHQGAIVGPVFMEHVQQLGPTLRDIAIEKAGVVTPETAWVCAHPQADVVAEVLRDACAARGARLRVLGEGITHRIVRDDRADELLVEVADEDGAAVVRLHEDVASLAHNAAVALDAARQVWRAVRGGEPFPRSLDLRHLRLPGRMHVLSEQPLLVVDGTIHRSSAQMVANWVRRKRASGKVRMVGAVLGLPDDKDGAGVLAALCGHADWVVLTRARNPHLRFDRGWLTEARSLFPDVATAPDVAAAWAVAKQRIGREDAVLFLGTQSFVGDTLSLFGADTTSLWREPCEG